MQKVNFKRYLSVIDYKLIIILAFGCISFTTVTISIPWDLLGYMTHALNIINGNGYTYIDGQPVLFRGPVFPLLIAASFQIFGVSPESAFHVVRLFCIANPILIYFFGKRLFNAEVGFVASLLILTSYSISFWSYRHLDAVWPSFVIFHSYLLYEGFERKKVIYFIAAGISLGTAYLIKEVALLFFPLSLLMLLFIKEYRAIYNFKYIIYFLAALMITLFPWVFYLWRHDALHFLWGAGGPIVLNEITNSFDLNSKGGWFLWLGVDPFLVIRDFLSAFVYFYNGPKNTVSSNFIIAPLFLVAWIFLIINFFRGNRSYKILAINILLFMPIVYFLGKNHWRFGQVIIVMLLTYLVISCIMFKTIAVAISLLRISNSRLVSIIFYICSVVMIYTQSFSSTETNHGYVEFLENTYLFQLVSGGNVKSSVNGNYDDQFFNQVIEKLNGYSDNEYTILADFDNTARSVFLKLQGKFNVVAMPYLGCTKDGLILRNPPEDKQERAIILFSGSNPLEPSYTFYMGFESDILKLIIDHNVKYIVITPGLYFLNQYFSSSKNYDEVFSAGPIGGHDKKYILYRVRGELKRDDFQHFVTSEQVIFALNELKNNDYSKFTFMRDAYLYGIASLTKKDVSSILESIVNIPRFHIDNGDKFYKEGDIPQAIIEYKEAYRLDPNNSDIIRQLENLYLKDDQQERVIEELLADIKSEPANSGYNYLLGSMYREAGLLEKAVIQIEAAIHLDPARGIYYKLLGDVYRQTGKQDKAMEQYQIAVKLDPENASYHNLLGQLYQESGIFDQAQKFYETAIRLNPENGAYYRFLGDLFKQKGDLDKSIMQYRKAIKFEPGYSGYYYLLGSVYQEAGFLKRAKTQFEAAIRLDPENAWYYRFLGQLYELLGQPDRALEQYRQAVRLAPENTSFHYLSGNLYRKMGLSHEALRQYKELLSLEPENPQYRKLVEQFEADLASKAQ